MPNRASYLLVMLASLVLSGWAWAAGCPRNPADYRPMMDAYARALRVSDPVNADRDLILLQAVAEGNVTALKSLLAKATNPNTVFHLPGGVVISLLDIAASSCQDDTARLLIDAGADVNGSGTSFVPLGIAASSGDVALTNLLVMRGATIDKPDFMGQTPLEFAVRLRQPVTVAILLQYDHHADRTLPRGGTVLDLVAYSDDPADQAIARELRAHGVTRGLDAKTR